MKVEQALQLLPPLEAIGPLRGLVLASSTPDERSRWGSAAPYLTVGKWDISLEALRRAIPGMIDRIAAHLAKIYTSYSRALEAEQQGDRTQVVAHLLAAARLEADVGRFMAAISWGEVALGVAEGLNARRGEVEALSFLGEVCREQGDYQQAARHYQRALVLAEAEVDHAGAIAASEGQGLVALAQGQLPGATAWLSRAERLAEPDAHALQRARVIRSLAKVAKQEGDLGKAQDRLAQVRAILDKQQDPREMAITLDAQGELDLARGEAQPALAAYREALAWELRAGRDARVESGIHLHLADLFLGQERIVEAEEEMRHAEKLAIEHDLGRRLVQVYTRLGALRGKQEKETGFVFFEQALGLCRLIAPDTTLEAEVYRQYGLFKAAFGRKEEARTWLDRARDRFARAGATPALELVEEEIRHLAQ